MSFVVVAAGHSGTKLLSLQLGAAPGWTVRHEPDAHTLLEFVKRRFDYGKKYGEVNSYLLQVADSLRVDRGSVLLRNPYEIAESVAIKHGATYALTYVREAIARLDVLASIIDFNVIRFREITSEPEAVVMAAASLGVTLPLNTVRVHTRLNPHRFTRACTLTYDRVTQDEFDYFVYRYDL